MAKGIADVVKGPGHPMFPLRMSGGKVIAYREAASSPSAAVSLDPESGEETILLLFGQASVPEVTALEPPDVVYERGRIFLSATGVARAEDDGPRLPLMRGFESSG
ncbi:hypothetical protein J2N69_27370 [Streptomyces huasconensis]|uniref:hypothetical protein n=1 Tax=Streptomyces huasconensis TaxID=1854574 RepID=UPI001E5C197E|nr:hypothetical protein [Streptomyces huasconensis]UFQ18415.1 hypothetical protein J2N69_27370 [Streptomyces huasconensis]